jgi:predicted small integral membrane protein
VHSSGISIWFFIGVSLLVNGLLITGAGIWEFTHPPANPTIVLFSVHANVWWGAILAVVGALYCLKFAPKRAV